MSEKHLKKCLTSLAIKEIQMATINKTSDSTHWQECEVRKYSSIASGSATLYIHYGNQCGSSSGEWELNHLKIQLYNLWAYTQKDALSYNKVLTCSTMFIAASSIISRNWKQPRCPSTEG